MCLISESDWSLIIISQHFAYMGVVLSAQLFLQWNDFKANINTAFWKSLRRHRPGSIFSHYNTWVNIWGKPLAPLTWRKLYTFLCLKHFPLWHIFRFILDRGHTFLPLAGSSSEISQWGGFKAPFDRAEMVWFALFLMKTLKFVPFFLHLNNIWWSSNQGVNFFNCHL